MNQQDLISFDIFVEKYLNDAQREAVLHDSGSLLIIAGAGSGKTRVITARIARLLLTEQATSDAILALTFTNKAAREMNERIHRFLPNATKLPFIGTFHSFCVLLLKKYSHLLEKPFFSILDDTDQEKIIKGILKSTGLEKRYTARSVLYAISSVKNKTVQPSNPPLYDLPAPLQEIYLLYEREKRASFTYDFDDLLIEVLRLFITNEEFRIHFQHTVQHILVDEYQDTNLVQHELLKTKALFKRHFAINSLFVVGDEDQSIYSWRGAEVANMQNFLKDFPHTAVIKIEQNYRSTKHILHIANELIVNNVQRTPKILVAVRQGNIKPIIFKAASDYQEASIIAKTITIIKQQNSSYNFAVLYRAHSQSRTIEEELLKNSIPYIIVGGIQFYERKEIKDLLAYLRLLVNPYDRAACLRVVNVPTRGLGAKTEELLKNTWSEQSLFSFFDLIKYVIEKDLIPESKKKSLQQFSDIFDELNGNSPADVALSQIITKSGYATYLRAEYDEPDVQDRFDNIDELRRAIEHFKNIGHTKVEAVVHEIALLQDKAFAQKEDTSIVSLMTLHASKGLEFDVVFVPGLEEGVLPAQRSLGDGKAIDEERRLLYVGFTRARELLILSHAQYRYTYAQVTTQVKSRFLDEISETSCINFNALNKQYADILLFLKNTFRELPTIQKKQQQPIRD